MKRLAVFLSFVVALLLFSTSAVYANTVWQMGGDEETTIEERVFTDDEDLINHLARVGFVYDDTDECFYRDTKDWQTYNSLTEKFPILVHNNNFAIFSINTLLVDSNNETNILRNYSGPVKLEFTAYGLYFKNSGDKVGDYTTSYLFSNPNATGFSKDILTKFLSFDGLILGIGIFVLGVLIITVVYYRMISRVDKLIVEEYSIENYLNKQAEAEVRAKEANTEAEVKADVSANEMGIDNADNNMVADALVNEKDDGVEG